MRVSQNIAIAETTYHPYRQQCTASRKYTAYTIIVQVTDILKINQRELTNDNYDIEVDSLDSICVNQLKTCT